MSTMLPTLASQALPDLLPVDLVDDLDGCCTDLRGFLEVFTTYVHAMGRNDHATGLLWFTGILADHVGALEAVARRISP